MPACSRNRPLRRWISLGLLLPNIVFAAQADPIFTLHGTGVVSRDAPVQKSGTLSLKAALSPADVALNEPQLLSESRFSLSEVLSAESMVCYNDTIFRDDFDGDGF